MKLILFFGIIFLDQLTKYIITNSLSMNSTYKIFPFFDLINIHNKGISFGLFSENFPTWLITIIVGLVIIILIYWFFITDKIIEKWGLMIITSGAFGNFIDRLLHNHVVDFLYFHYKSYYWPAFNIADIAITIGVTILIIATYRDYKYRFKQ